MRKPPSFVDTLLWRSARVRPLGALLCSAVFLTACELLPLSQDDAAEQVQEAAPAVEAPAEPVYLDLNRKLVLKIQQQLTDLGYRPGPIDGAFGPSTKEAVASYQRAKGLPSDGAITDALVTYLDAESPFTPKDGSPKAAGSAGPPANANASPKAGIGPAPAYLAGSRYFFSDHSVYEVLAVKGERVEWRSSRGEKFTGDRVFLVPPSSWTTRDEAGQRVFDRAPKDLWSALSASDVAFVATSTRRRDAEPEASLEISNTWRCRVGTRERITVTAGRFDTRELICERLAETGAIDLIRSWHYAPRLRHFVRRRDLNPVTGAAESVDLVAIMPQGRDWPPAAAAGLDMAVQHALEELPAGQSLKWASSAVEHHVTLRAGRRLASADASDCRRFRQIWVIGGKTWTFPSVACRDETGLWTYPNFGDGSRVAQSGF